MRAGVIGKQIPELIPRVFTLTDESNSKQNEIVSSQECQHLSRRHEWKIRCRRRDLRGN